MKKMFLGILAGVWMCAGVFGGCAQNPDSETSAEKEEVKAETEAAPEENTDYQVKYLSMSQEEKEEVSEKLLAVTEKCQPIFEQADKGSASNVVLEEAAVHKMAKAAAADGTPVTCGGHDLNMHNYELVDSELQKARESEDAKTEFYVIDANGIFRYYRFQFEGGELSLTFAGAVIGQEGPVIQQMEKIQPYQWEYTEKGWLIWEKALSRNQEMDMHVFCRVLPLDKKCREITEKYIASVGYTDNNLFLVDWDKKSRQQIVFNDLFDSLYRMETGSAPDQGAYSEGIPKEEFETRILPHFDMTPEELEQYGAYDQEKGVYPWYAVGPRNQIQRTSPLPEVVKYVENEDGTLSIYVEAVFIQIGKDCAFRHIVTAREEDGKWIYLGNQIDWEEAYTVPAYKARKEYVERKTV